MILGGAVILGDQPLVSIIRWPVRVSGATAATLHLAPEILVCAALVLVVNVVFWVLLTLAVKARTGRYAGWIEPPLFGVLVGTGIVAIYPAELRHPLFWLLRPLPVFVVILLLGLAGVGMAVLLGYKRTGRWSGSALFGAAALAVIVVSAVVTAIPVPHDGTGLRDSILLFGVDSLAQTQDLAILRDMAGERSWTWYSHPVTPGLLTNSVWPSIVMNRFPHETGCFLTFQDPNWDRSPYHMVREAESHGYETWSFFSDQFTTYVGTNGGFQVDRSGPKGWLQPATAAIKDASILLPVALPRLPRIPLAKTPRNQSATFAFDVEREIDEIMTAGNGTRVFVASHLDYLHQPAYPGMHELSSEELIAVLRTPVRHLRDLSLHWEYPPMKGEPLGLYAWKLNRLQRLIVDAIDRHGIVDPARKNKVVIFSDHGPRGGLHPDEFSRKHLYKVVLITSGMERRDPSIPISLLDLDLLAGLTDGSRPFPDPPVVEYTHVRNLEEGMVLMRSATLKEDGELQFNPWILARFGQQLKAWFPHEAHRGYVSVPAVPGEMDLLAPRK